MSRSYRRPFVAITGLASAKSDKQLAHRGVRRKQNLAIKICIDFDNFLPPHPLECPWNNTWCWGRDGAQSDCSYLRHSDDEWDQKHYRKLLRK